MMKWSKNEDDILKAGLSAGVTMREVVQKLPGRNRNMAIGRSHRLAGTVFECDVERAQADLKRAERRVKMLRARLQDRIRQHGAIAH